MRTVSVPLTQGKVAVIDEADWRLISQYKWRAFRGGLRGRWYAATWTGQGSDRRLQLLHRIVTDAPVGVEVDHRNGDGLDNRRANLRLASRNQNLVNRGRRSDNTSGYKGVYRARSGAWQAQLRFMGQMHYLGTFVTAEEAARAYDHKARELHGEFARPNFPD